MGLIFSAKLPQVLNGNADQTRRLVRPGYTFSFERSDRYGYAFQRYVTLGDRHQFPPQVWGLVEVRNNNRLVWKRKGTYAVVPGRGKKAVARLEIISMWLEHLQDISESDVHDELGDLGFWVDQFQGPAFDAYWAQFHVLPATAMFKWLWNSIHTRTGERWDENPMVVGIHFEVIGGPDGRRD